MNSGSSSSRGRICMRLLLRGFGVLLVMVFLSAPAASQSGLITFEQSEWDPLLGYKLYHGGPANTFSDPFYYGVSFIIAYGEMTMTSMGPGLRSLFFSPNITSTGTTDPCGMVVIRFTNAKERVQLKASHDEHPIASPDYMKVEFYAGINKTNLLHTESIPWNAGAYSTIAYENAVTGIREVVVTTVYLENNLDNIEFVQLGSSQSFDDGTLQGWTLAGAYVDGSGPYAHGFASMWKDEIDFPSPPGQAAAGDNRGSCYMGCTGGHGITGASGTWWIMQLHSPDLSAASAWQTATGYTVQLANCMGPSTVYANLFVKVYDNVLAKDRWFYNGDAQALLHDTYGDAVATWNYLTFDWSGIGTFPTDYSLKEVFVNIWGTMAGTYEGGVAIDAVTPVYDTPVPIQLAHFVASVLDDHRVVLTWRTLSETNNSGFEIQRKGIAEPDFATLDGAFVPGHGTTIEPQDYAFTDATVGPGVWLYRLKQIDLDGSVIYSPTVEVTMTATGISSGGAIPAVSTLSQNYPNPFNPTTTMRYSVGQLGSRQQAVGNRFVRLAVYDLLGREVAVLVDEQKAPGSYEVTWDASGLPSGVYAYRMTAGSFQQSRKMVLTR